jgi:hypothetical protein
LTSQASIDPRHEHLRRLREALEAVGDYSVRLLEDGAMPLSLHVGRLGTTRLTEDIGAECDRDGTWLLTWSWGDRICAADDTTTALASIRRVLSLRD